MKYYKPSLPKKQSWYDVVETIRELGPERANNILITQTNNKTEFNSKDETIQALGSKITNLEQLKDVGQIDTEKWEVTKYIENFWGNDINPNWQVKAWLGRKGLEEPDKSWTDKWMSGVFNGISLPDIEVSDLTNKPVVLVITDLHIGAINEDNRVIPDYNKEKCMLSVLEAVSEVNRRFPNRPVYVAVLGDLIESFTGKNHKDTWKQIELHGAKAAFMAFDVLNHAIRNLDNFKKMYLISGNHDRVTSDRRADQEGQVAEIVYETFKRATNIDIEFDPLVLSPVIDGVQYILLHGDNPLAKKNSSVIVEQYGDSTRFNLIMSAHIHCRKYIDDTFKSRHIVHPSVVTGTPFSLRLGVNSRSGVVVHERSKEGSVNSTFIDL